jgi:3-hydroxyisobutyrate dehydrogenase
MKLGYIGLGRMGGALTRRLMLSHKLRVYDLRPEAVEEFAKAGAVPAQNPISLAQESDIILTCLPTSAEVREAIFGPQGVLQGLEPGKLIVDQTTGDPNETRRMVAELAEKGIDMIDAPVSGGPQGAEAGTIAIMVGGPEGLYQKAKPYLDAISSNVFHCGGVGAGHTMKLVNNCISACCRIATFEAITMGAKNGLSLDKMVDVLAKGSAQNSAITNQLPRMMQGRAPTFSLELLHKDVRLACQLGIDSGAPMYVPNLVREFLQTAIQVLGGDAGSNQVLEIMERNAGVKVLG